MYCKNCGSAVEQGAAICTNCGVPVGQGTNYCENCGTALQPGAAVCMSCGFAANATVKAPAMPGAKSKIAAGLLAIFLGGWGVHNFYLGYTGKAVAQLCITIGAIILSAITCGIATPLALISPIWALVEGIMILCGSIKTDANGIPLAD
ncbi:MAG: TM2 domain-containing protein [Ruminococcus sp.]|nr:TM2 domain-containing protein [Ruminococcus sp.]